MNAGATKIDSQELGSPDWHRTILLIVLAICAGTGLVWSLEQAQQGYPGSLEADKTVIPAGLAARVKEISVSTGNSVAPGDRLFELTDSDLEDKLIAKRREIVELEAELVRTNALAQVEITWRRRDLQADIFETQLKITAFSQEKLNKQVEQLAWKDRLSASEPAVVPIGTSTGGQFRNIALTLQKPDDQRFLAMLREDAAAATVETLTAQITLCDRRLKNLETLDKELDGKIRASSGVDVTEARLRGAKTELISLENQMEELVVNSTVHGTIGEIHFSAGEHVPTGNPVLDVLNEKHMHIMAQIPAKVAASVKEGAVVELIFPAHERRSGIVASVPAQTIPGSTRHEPVLLVKIEPSGRLWPKLALGTTVNVVLK